MGISLELRWGLMNIQGNIEGEGLDVDGAFGATGKLGNDGRKTIKSCTLYFITQNAFGERLVCDRTNAEYFTIMVPGPIKPGDSRGFSRRVQFYNHSTDKVIVVQADIIYTDGTEERIDGTDIELKGGGCYVATAVYGSYDCPQVWVLRRYRDYTLAETWYGRALIHTYYAISPTLVKYMGNTRWFKKMCKWPLDCMVENLRNNGVLDTKYKDRVW